LKGEGRFGWKKSQRNGEGRFGADLATILQATLRQEALRGRRKKEERGKREKTGEKKRQLGGERKEKNIQWNSRGLKESRNSRIAWKAKKTKKKSLREGGVGPSKSRPERCRLSIGGRGKERGAAKANYQRRRPLKREKQAESWETGRLRRIRNNGKEGSSKRRRLSRGRGREVLPGTPGRGGPSKGPRELSEKNSGRKGW